MGNLGATELLIIGVIILLLFGAKRLPEIGSSIGKGIREFKKSINEIDAPSAPQQMQSTDQRSLPGRQFDAPDAAGTSGEPKRLSQ